MTLDGAMTSCQRKGVAHYAAAGWLSAALLLLLCAGLPAQRAGWTGLAVVASTGVEVRAPRVIQAVAAAPALAAAPERQVLVAVPALPHRTHCLREYGLPAPRAP